MTGGHSMKLYMKVFCLNIIPFITIVVGGNEANRFLQSVAEGRGQQYWLIIFSEIILILGCYTCIVCSLRKKDTANIKFSRIRPKISQSLLLKTDCPKCYRICYEQMEKLENLHVIDANESVGKIIGRSNVTVGGGAGEKVAIFLHQMNDELTLVKIISYSIGGCYIPYKNLTNTKKLRESISEASFVKSPRANLQEKSPVL